jgi:DNA-binding CsgD family transcriptional regulator
MSIDITRASLKNHPLFTRREFMQSFLTTLKNFGFTYFCYHRVLDAHQRIILSSKPEVSELFINKKLYKLALHASPESYSSGIFLHDFLNTQEIKHALSTFNLNSGVILVKKQVNFLEFFFWYAPKSTVALNHFIINNIDLFEAWIQEFRGRAQPILKQYQKNPLFYPRGVETIGLNQPLKQRPHFEYLLSPREREIFYLIKMGLSSKKMALQLNISNRTVDKHIENMFVKTNCNSRIELLQKINFIIL